jgi:hypothetical protein
MVAKRGKKPTKKIKALPTKNLSTAQAKKVKGGFIWFEGPNQTTAMGDGSVRNLSLDTKIQKV